jgi:hypothetical protein
VFKKLWEYKVKFIAIVLTLGIISLPVLHFVITDFFLMPQIESDHKKIMSYFPRILTDLKTVSENPPFPQNALNNNAEKFISRYVSWEGDGLSPLTSDSHTALKELFKKYPEWKTDSKKFKALYADSKLMEIDATWIDQLKNYSHWDFSSHQSIIDDLKRVPDSSGIARIGIFANLPIPNYSEFRQWAIVYTLQKSQKGRTIEGLEAFRKMAQLSHSSGTLVGNMIAVAMLNDEHVLSENIELNDWELVPKKKIEAYKRVSWAWPGLVRTTWFHSFPKEFEPYLKPETGACAAAWVYSGGLTAFQDFLEDKIVFEKDFSKNLEYSREFQKFLLSTCNMKNYEGFVSRTPAGANPIVGRGYNSYFMMDSGKVNNSIALNWIRIPYVRQMIGLNLITISIPNYLKLYDQAQK